MLNNAPVGGSNSTRFNSRISSYTSRTITVKGKAAHFTQNGKHDPGKDENLDLKLTFLRILGKGTFGCIEQAQLNDRQEPVAVKRVYQDPRYKNRELDILLSLSNHPNLVQLLYYYYTSTSSKSQNTDNVSEQNPEIYLHLVMECFPESLADLIIRYSRRSHKIPIFDIKLYMYQLMRALGYIHLQEICHRDIKSSNLLVNESSGQVKLCDFGSAKKIVPDQPNVAYISSRYYRAPELIFGAENYDCSIDVWSAGCVVAELLMKKCLFMGSDSVDQLAEIIKVLGTPSAADIKSMNPKYSSYNFPNVPSCPLKLYMPMETPKDFLLLLSKMLVYCPSSRIKLLAALADPTFDELRARKSSDVSHNKANSVSENASSLVSARVSSGVTSSRLTLPPLLFKFLQQELDAESSLISFNENHHSENGELSTESTA